MNRLTVLYDGNCGFCVTCRWWLADQPAFIPLEFVPAGSPEATRRFPDLHEAGELSVVSDDGQVWTGASAWIMCLFALEDYRELAIRLSTPRLMPVARRLFEAVSNGRGKISRWFGLKSEDQLFEALHREEA